jgi:hypothetical protein
VAKRGLRITAHRALPPAVIGKLVTGVNPRMPMNAVAECWAVESRTRPHPAPPFPGPAATRGSPLKTKRPPWPHKGVRPTRGATLGRFLSTLSNTKTRRMKSPGRPSWPTRGCSPRGSGFKGRGLSSPGKSRAGPSRLTPAGEGLAIAKDGAIVPRPAILTELLPESRIKRDLDH